MNSPLIRHIGSQSLNFISLKNIRFTPKVGFQERLISPIPSQLLRKFMNFFNAEGQNHSETDMDCVKCILSFVIISLY